MGFGSAFHEQGDVSSAGTAEGYRLDTQGTDAYGGGLNQTGTVRR